MKIQNKVIIRYWHLRMLLQTEFHHHHKNLCHTKSQAMTTSPPQQFLIRHWHVHSFDELSSTIIIKTYDNFLIFPVPELQSDLRWLWTPKPQDASWDDFKAIQSQSYISSLDTISSLLQLQSQSNTHCTSSPSKLAYGFAMACKSIQSSYKVIIQNASVKFSFPNYFTTRLKKWER